jgi:hypothetical protein
VQRTFWGRGAPADGTTDAKNASVDGPLGGGAIADGETDAKNASVDGP